MGEPPMNVFLEACGARRPPRLEITGGGQVGRHSLLTQPFAIIGRDPRADLCLDDGRVSKRHAYLQIIHGRLFCVDLGSRTGTRQHERVCPSGWVDDVRPVGIGPYQIKLEPDDLAAPRGAAEPEDAPSPLYGAATGPDRLPTVFLEALNVKSMPSWRIDPVLTLVGKSADCLVRFSDVGMSRFHCSLLRTPLGVWVVDLLGQGGIEVNGERVRYARLDEGDELRVGEIVFRTGQVSTSAPGSRIDALLRTGAKALASPAPRPAVPVRRARALPGRSRHGGESPPSLPQALPSSAGPAPQGWQSTAHEPGRIVLERPTDPVIELVVQQFDRMQQQMGSMQQQMSDQFHQTMMAVFQMVGTMQRDQMSVVHEELEQIRRLSQELKVLQNGSADGASALPGRASAAAPGRQPSDPVAGARRPDGRGSSEPHPRTDSPANSPSGRAPAGPGRKPEGPTPAKAAPRRDRTAVTGDDGAAGPPTPADQWCTERPTGMADYAIHDMLSHRIAEIQRERQSRWQRILGLVAGS